MKLLYSNILPLAVSEGEETIADAINNQMQLADRIEIAVGYVSRASLEELDLLVEKNNIKNICLNIGMYFIEGMPEGSYHTAIRINKKWQDMGIGEIRMVKSFKYHGKLYAFYKDNKPFSAIIGSANLGVIKLEANNRRQYEISTITEDISEVEEILRNRTTGEVLKKEDYIRAGISFSKELEFESLTEGFKGSKVITGKEEVVDDILKVILDT